MAKRWFLPSLLLVLLFVFLSCRCSLSAFVHLNPFPSGQDLNDLTEPFVCPSGPSEPIVLAVGKDNAVASISQNGDLRALSGVSFRSNPICAPSQSIGSNPLANWQSVAVDPASGVVVTINSIGTLIAVSSDCGLTWTTTCISSLSSGTMASFTNGRFFVGGVAEHSNSPIYVSSDLGKTWIRATNVTAYGSYDGLAAMEWIESKKVYFATAGVGEYPHPQGGTSAAFVCADPEGLSGWTLHELTDSVGCRLGGLQAMSIDETKERLLVSSVNRASGYFVPFETLLSDWSCMKNLGDGFSWVSQLIHLGSEDWMAVGVTSALGLTLPAISFSANGGETWNPQDLNAHQNVRLFRPWNPAKGFSSDCVAVGRLGSVASGSLTNRHFKTLQEGFTTNDVLYTFFTEDQTNVLVTESPGDSMQNFLSFRGTYEPSGLDDHSAPHSFAFLNKQLAVTFGYCPGSPWHCVAIGNKDSFLFKTVYEASMEMFLFDVVLMPDMFHDNRVVAGFAKKDGTCGAIVSFDLMGTWKVVPAPFPCKWNLLTDDLYFKGPVLTWNNTVVFSNTTGQGTYTLEFPPLQNPVWHASPKESIPLYIKHIQYSSSRGCYLGLYDGWFRSTSGVLFASQDNMLRGWKPILSVNETNNRMAQAFTEATNGDLIVVGELGLCLVLPVGKTVFRPCDFGDQVPLQTYSAVATMEDLTVIAGPGGFVAQSHSS